MKFRLLQELAKWWQRILKIRQAFFFKHLSRRLRHWWSRYWWSIVDSPNLDGTLLMANSWQSTLDYQLLMVKSWWVDSPHLDGPNVDGPLLFVNFWWLPVDHQLQMIQCWQILTINSWIIFEAILCIRKRNVKQFFKILAV